VLVRLDSLCKDRFSGAAMLMGEFLLVDMHVPLPKLDHRAFSQARLLVEDKGDTYFQQALEVLKVAVNEVAPPTVQRSLRRPSAIFRRSDLFDYLPKPDATTGLPDPTAGLVD
jgi:hypothetical protein